MRAKYYALTLRQMSFKKPFVFFLIFFLMFFLIIYLFNSKIRPTIKLVRENEAKSIATNCSNEAIYSNIENITYDNLITLNKDNFGKVTSLSANTKEINKLTTKISRDIESKLQNNNQVKVTMPLYMLFNENLVSGYGPKIKLKTFPIGDIKTELKSNFETAGINQTRHSLILEVTSQVKVIAPFISETQEYTTSIVIAETVIVSDTPSAYYNIRNTDSTNGTNSSVTKITK